MPPTEDPQVQFNLTPHPRILPMLGEIVLPQWRCLAKLVDNSVDAFLEAQRACSPVQGPLVRISTPTTATHGSRLSVQDNGPGMDPATLERAARAGWTSHDPINNLGLFGMGFNIATARLGSRTSIWTTRAGDLEWTGLQIDFEQLIRQQAFITQVTTRPKSSPDTSGTEVIIERLKPEQLEWFAKRYNRTNIARQLGRVYSSMIGPSRTPVGFRLEVNGTQVQPKLHCIWGGPGNPERVAETAKLGPVSAFQSFDVRLEARPFCTQCWNWLGVGQSACPSCGSSGVVVQRQRRVHGWLGMQRYLDQSDYGIDILRNGRKIEVGNKDLFSWFDENSDAQEIEYPIDDPRDRGRIVGEVHLDHCRVPYTKDRFVREDSAWSEMTQIVRGNTPLRPEIAGRMGAGENNSPLYRLFQAFRRSNPHNRRTGGWARLLVVQDNERAQAMAKHFDAGESEYQTDEKWWDLVEEADAEVLHGGNPPPTTETLGGNPQAPLRPTPNARTQDHVSSRLNEPGAAVVPPPTPNRARLASLSRQFTDDLSGQRYDVLAFAAVPSDPALSDICP
jgi:Histidine kinase-, DNA gyrase B-, and HSP90-like ATPase